MFSRLLTLIIELLTGTRRSGPGRLHGGVQVVAVRVLLTTVVEQLAVTLRLQNQAMSVGMIGTDVRRPEPPTAADGAEPAQGTGLLFTVLAILTAAGLGALAFVSARAADPILLGILSVLGMVGSFFLFGLAAGHIRIGDQPDVDGGIAAAAADLITPGVMITSRDGSIVYANAAYRALAGLDDDGEPRSLEVAFAGEPQAAECLFRLLRAAELGEIRSEEFRVRDLDSRDRSGRWLRLSVRPLSGDAGGRSGGLRGCGRSSTSPASGPTRPNWCAISRQRWGATRRCPSGSSARGSMVASAI